MRATRYARGLNKEIFWLISLALLLALVLPSDGTGVVQADPGPGTAILRPNGAGNETALSIGGTSPAASNWESVDEVSSDDDVTYVEASGGVYATDLYNLDDTSLSGAIRRVTIYVNCKGTKLGVGACTRIKTHGAARNGDDITLTTSYANYSTTYDMNPETEEAWTWDEINALQAGVGLQKPTGGAVSRCTQVWVVVDYFSTAIEIRAQDYSTPVTAITFPVGAPSTEVSNPSNDKPETQTFGDAGVAKPVVTLVNSASVAYNIWYNITPFTNSIVSSENYVIIAKGGACANAAAITETATLDSSDHVTTGTITTINATGDAGEADERDLYLKITLSEVAGKSGTSTLTILGEAV